jgi:ATP-dependent DNA helicase RecQ
VLHFNLPGTLEAYYQEAGRAGRDGEPARVVLLYDPEDRALQEWFIENDTPSPGELRALYQAIRAPGKTEARMAASDLCFATGLHEVKVRLGLAQLEVAGIIQRLGDEKMQMSLRAGQWNEKAVRTLSEDVLVRRRHRRAQLRKMIAYAESNACRRRIVLDHFGDRSPAEAPRCCDNCLSRQKTSSPSQRGDFAKLSPSEQTALIILDAVRRLKWETGREKLAQMLHGSKAKAMKQFGYDQSPYYGRLPACPVNVLVEFTESLIAQGYLKVIGGSRPVLRLTPKGEAAIKARAAIPLRIASVAKAEESASSLTNRDTTAWKREPDKALHRERPSPQDRVHHVVQLGEEGSPSAVPELIAALQDSDGNVRRLAASALGKIRDRRAVEPLMALLEKEEKPQVRQYAVKALGRIGDSRTRALLEKIAADPTEREYTQTAARTALKRLSTDAHAG